MNWGETMPPPVEAGRELAFDWPIPATTIVVRDRAGDMPLPCDLPPWTWHAGPDGFTMHFGGFGIAQVRPGDRLDYLPITDHGDEAIRQALMTSPFGAQVRLRGDLPLHAATLVSPDGRACAAVCGESGSGKSTTAAALVQAGWSVLCDDISRVSTGDEVLVHRGFGRIKLHRDACDRLGLVADSMERALGAQRKFLLDAPVASGPCRPDAIIVLARREPQATDSPMQLKRVCLPAAIECLARQTYRHQLIVPLDATARHFRHMSALLACVPLVELSCSTDVTPSRIAERIAAFVRTREPR